MFIIYRLYDSTGACILVLDSYDAYLEYFKNTLIPAGKGTRYVYGCYNRQHHTHEYGMLVIDHA